MTSLQIILIIVGWIVVHKLSVKRDLDKSRREMLAKVADSLAESTQRFTNKSWDYHTKPRDLILENELKMLIQDISSRVNSLSDVSQNGKELAACRSATIALKRAVTGTHFEDEHSTPFEANANEIQAITMESLRFMQALAKFKHAQFK